MADFPNKVTTETSSPQSQGSQVGNNLRGMASNVTSMMDMSFIKSIPGILMMSEIVLGLLQWSLIASVPGLLPAYGWVLFVTVTLWILTILLFCMIICGVQHKLTFVPWNLTVLVYNGMAAVLYLTAFLANAASVSPYSITFFLGHMAVAAFFGAVVTVAYGASAFFSYMHWRGDGGDATTNTVPA